MTRCRNAGQHHGTCASLIVSVFLGILRGEGCEETVQVAADDVSRCLRCEARDDRKPAGPPRIELVESRLCYTEHCKWNVNIRRNDRNVTPKSWLSYADYSKGMAVELNGRADNIFAATHLLL